MERNGRLRTFLFANHGNPVRILYCQWLGFHQLHVSFCLSHNLNLLIKHDRLYEPVFLFLTCFQIAFCLDCARLGGKKYRSEARMIFSSQPPKGRSPCPIKGGRLPLQVRSRNIFFTEKKLSRYKRNSFNQLVVPELLRQCIFHIVHGLFQTGVQYPCIVLRHSC